MRYLKRDAIAKLSRAISIVDLAAERGLEPSGRGLLALATCPFCTRKKLVLHAGTNRFRCYSCSEWGNAIGLVARLDRLPMIGALRRIAFRAGLSFESFLTEACDCRSCARTRTPLWALTSPPVSPLEVR